MALTQPQFSSPHLAVRKFFLKTDATRRNQTRKTIGCLTRGKAGRDYNARLSRRGSPPETPGLCAEQTRTAGSSSSSNFPRKTKQSHALAMRQAKGKADWPQKGLLCFSSCQAQAPTPFISCRGSHEPSGALLKQTQELISSHTHDSFISLLLS